jgi:hypothetical protein
MMAMEVDYCGERDYEDFLTMLRWVANDEVTAEMGGLDGFNMERG